jgi:hypothetical protein
MHVKEGLSNSASSGKIEVQMEALSTSNSSSEKIEAQMEALSTSNSGRNLDYRCVAPRSPRLSVYDACSALSLRRHILDFYFAERRKWDSLSCEEEQEDAVSIKSSCTLALPLDKKLCRAQTMITVACSTTRVTILLVECL